MQFFIHSSQTDKWLLEAACDAKQTPPKDKWTEEMQKAKRFATPADALNTSKTLSTTAKAHIVLFDGLQAWNVSLSKAI